MKEKMYIMITEHVHENGAPTIMLDVYNTFEDAKNAAVNNADAQKRLETVVAEWVHDEHNCELAKHYFPSFNFVKPLFMIETRSQFMGKAITTYRAVIEKELIN